MNKGNTGALRLFGEYAVIFKNLGSKPKGSAKKTSACIKVELSEDDKRKIKAHNKRAKGERMKRQKEAGKMNINNDYEAMKTITEINNAGLRHLSTFINVIEYAQEHKKPVALGELKQRIGNDKKAVSEWRAIRNWLGKNSPKLCTVTIGKRTNGWWSIRWLVVADSETEDIFRLSAPFHLYLLQRRGWETKAVSMEADTKRLREHYLKRYEDDIEETFKTYVSEMFDVYRSALVMPESSRTYRTDGIYEVLCRKCLKVKGTASFVVNGNCYGNSLSGMALCEVSCRGNSITDAFWVGDKRNDWLEDVEFDDDCGEDGKEDF